MPRTTAPTKGTAPTDDAIFVSAKRAAEMLDLSRNQTYALMDEGLIECRYFGKRRLVVLSSLHAFANGLPTERAV